MTTNTGDALDKMLADLLGSPEDQGVTAKAANSNVPIAKTRGIGSGSKRPKTVTSPSNGSSALPIVRPALKGGTYRPNDALAMLNAWFFIASVHGVSPIAQIEGDTIKYISIQDFRTKLANVFVELAPGKRVKAANCWLAHEKRQERQIIFDPTQPSGAAVEGKYNLWRGHAIRARRATGKHRTLLRHIREVICRNDRGSFKYLLFWLHGRSKIRTGIPRQLSC